MLQDIKDINSFIYNKFDVNNCEDLLESFLEYPDIIQKYKKGFLKQIYRFIHIRPKIINYSTKIIISDSEYNEFIWKCLLKTMNIVPYINMTKKLITKILSLKECKINEFIYNNFSNNNNLVTNELILENISKHPRLIYLCDTKSLNDVKFIKKILHKIKYFDSDKIILNYLFDNHLPIIFNHDIMKLICYINCDYFLVYIEEYNYNFQYKINLIKNFLTNCTCILNHYLIDYNNLDLIYDFLRININCLDYIDLNNIKDKEDFLYNCCDINLKHSIYHFIYNYNYNISLNNYKYILDINHDIMNYVENENIRNKLIIYYYQNNYFTEKDDYLSDIKNLHITLYKKKNIPIEIKKNIYSYLYNIV